MGKGFLQYKGIKRILAVLTFLSAIQGVAILLQAILLARVVTHLFHGDSIEDLYQWVSIFVGFFILRYVTVHIKQKIIYLYANKIGADLRKTVLTNLFHIGPRVSKQLGTGSIVTLLIEGVTQFQQYLILFLPKMLNMSVIPVIILAYIFFQDKTSAIILIITVPILVGFMILLGLAAKKKADKQWGMFRILSNHFVDSLRGLETLTYLGLSRSHTEKIAKVSERYRKTSMGTLKIAFLSSFAMDFFTMLSIATVAVFLGLRLVDGEMLLEPALAILILAPEYFQPIREIGSDYHATLNGQEAGRKLLEIANIPPFTVEQNLKISNWSNKNRFELHSISVRYEQHGVESLSEVSLSVNGLQKIGIVGESGAGKSTLIDTIAGFVEVSAGKIQIDKQRCTHLHQQEWQKQVNYIPQHPYIFHDTLLNNIKFYSPQSTTAEVEWAVVQAGLSELVKELPNGLYEKIGEGGRSLSGGQSQRVALARAFLGKRPVLLLDEPTAHLDVETEYELKEKMLSLFTNKLVFIATHRIHWMQEMDYVYFLKKGRVVEEGTHKELMEKKGEYYLLAITQMEGSV
ncbi:thiol reductant ABC exporter subunit CydD [Robertmurraya sp. P23]|uniref:thiol reductant ABC exporter subunit CydD n=1 Tax=Robertmurraya sp. P23 TaxID=3436931 RepID=UPI003D98C829